MDRIQVAVNALGVLPIDELEDQFVKDIVANNFTDGTIPFGIFNQIDGRQLTVDLLDTVEALRSINFDEDVGEDAFWEALRNNCINVHDILCLIYISILQAQCAKATLADKKLGLTAAQLYFVLLLVPGSRAYGAYRAGLLLAALQLFVLPKAKHVQSKTNRGRKRCRSRSDSSEDVTGDSDDTFNQDDIYDFMQSMTVALKDLLTVLEFSSFKSDGEVIESCIGQMCQLTSLDVSGRTVEFRVNAFLREDNSFVYVTTYAFWALQLLCREENGDPLATFREVAKALLPNLLMLKAGNTQTVPRPVLNIRDSTCKFIVHMVRKLGNDGAAEEIGLATLQHLALQAVERTEYRMRTCQVILTLMLEFSDELIAKYFDFAMELAHSVQVRHRLVALELFGQLLEQDSSRISSSYRERMTTCTVRRCLDKMATVRAKALNVLTSITAKQDWTALLMEASNPEEAVDSMLQILSGRLVDEKVHVRRAALTVLENVLCTRLDFSRSGHVSALLRACRDATIMVRKQDMKPSVSDLSRKQQQDAAALAYQQALAQEQHNAAMAAYQQQLAQYQQAYNAAYGQLEQQQKVRRTASNAGERSPRRASAVMEPAQQVSQSGASRSVMSMPRQPQGLGPYASVERTASKTGGEGRHESHHSIRQHQAQQVKQRHQLSSGGLSHSVPKHLHDPQMYMSQEQMYTQVPQMVASSKSMASLSADKQMREQMPYYSPQIQRRPTHHQGDSQKLSSTTAVKTKDNAVKAKRSASQQQPKSKAYPMTAEQYEQYSMYQQMGGAAQWGQGPPGYGHEHSWYQRAVQVQPQSLAQQQYAVHMVNEVTQNVDPFREAGDSVALKQAAEKRNKGMQKYGSQVREPNLAMYGMAPEGMMKHEDVAQMQEKEEESSESESSEESESETESSEEEEAAPEPQQPQAAPVQQSSSSQEAHTHRIQYPQGAIDPQQQWQIMQQYMQQNPNAAPAIQAAYQQHFFQQQQLYMMQQQQQQTAAAAQKQAPPPQGAIYPQQPMMQGYMTQQPQQMQGSRTGVGAAPSQQSLSENQKKKVYFAQGQKVALEQPPQRMPVDPRSYSRTSFTSQGTPDSRSVSSTTNMITPLLRPIAPLKQQTKTRMENMCLALNVVLFSVLAGVVAAFIVQQFSR